MGGGWYDLVELHGGRIGMVVGACAGHGLAAATVMGQVRSACRALLLQEKGRRVPPGAGIGRAVTTLHEAGEAGANAIEHGHRNIPGQHIRLRAEATVRRLRVTITDAGRWQAAQPPDTAFRGRGIALMRALMEQVSIEPGTGGDGTTVRMQLRIAPAGSASA